MFWSSPVAPKVGGDVARALNDIRVEIEARRAELRDERGASPAMADFYAGKSVFLTGGSGFLGRLVVEMLLRTCPDIGNVYLVVRAKKGVRPEDRLKALVDVPLFDRLRAERPGALDKVVVLPGDITALKLGLSDEHQDLLRREVAVVIHLAASVRFDDPFQKAVFTNLRSTREVCELAKGMVQLKSLVHVSTAYTNINRVPLEEVVYDQPQDWRDVIRWAEELEARSPRALDFLSPKIMGFQPNTYTFTKALAEKLIDDYAQELPVIITRPSIVVATFRDPIPGWMDNLYGLAGFWAGGFKGVMRIVYSPNVHFDSIPADMATKTILLASWHRGIKRYIRADSKTTGSEVVNVTVGAEAGVSYKDMSWVVSEAGIGRLVPYPGAIRPPKFEITACKFWFWMLFLYHHILYAIILDSLARMSGAKPRVLDIYRRVVVALDATSPFQQNFVFLVDNQKALQTVMHPVDEEHYSYIATLRIRDSIEHFRTVCVDSVRGILKYVLKEEDNPEKNWRHIARLKWIMAAYHSLMAFLFFSLVYGLLSLRPAPVDL